MQQPFIDDIRLSEIDRPLRVMFIGRFSNPKQTLAHLLPLVRSPLLQRLHFVTEEVCPDLEKVEYLTPPAWLRRTLGRSGARAVWAARCAWQLQPDLILGGALLPNGLVAW